jgi:hypothetical protein
MGHNVFELAQLVATAEITRQVVALDPELRRPGQCLPESIEPFDRRIKVEQAVFGNAGKQLQRLAMSLFYFQLFDAHNFSLSGKRQQKGRSKGAALVNANDCL